MDEQKRKTHTSTEVKRRYNEKTYEQLTLSLPIGLKKQWKDLAEAKGLSVTKFIIQLVEKELDNN